MNYEKAYKEALERAKIWQEHLYEVGDKDYADELNYIFPELKESDDEKIRRGLINGFNECLKSSQYPISAQKYWHNIKIEDIFSWLERQGEQKTSVIDFKAKDWYVSKVDGKIHNIYNSVDKPEPKFNVGDWIIDNKNALLQVTKFEVDYGYELKAIDGQIFHFVSPDLVDANYHLWTIQDAKPGDVLVNGSNIFIFHFIKATRLMGYCHVNTDDGRFYYDIGKNECFCLIDAVVTPATNAQRDILFQKMKEAGYEWDNEKKELKSLVTNGGDFCESENCEQKPAKWSEEDERNLKGIIDEIEANKNNAPDYDIKTYDRFLSWLKFLKQRIGG